MIRRTRSVLVLIGLVLAFSFSYAHGPHGDEKQESSPAGSTERVQFPPGEIEETEGLGRGEIPAPEQPGVLELAGRFHSAVVHFPLAWLVMLLLVDLGTFLLGRVEWLKWGLYTLVATTASFVPALATGFLSAGHIAQGTELFSLLLLHRNLNLAVAGLCTLALVLRLARRNRIGGALKWVYLGLVFCATVLVAVSGHLGGKMVHGENFFPF